MTFTNIDPAIESIIARAFLSERNNPFTVQGHRRINPHRSNWTTNHGSKSTRKGYKAQRRRAVVAASARVAHTRKRSHKERFGVCANVG